jgi:hypothetical protein
MREGEPAEIEHRLDAAIKTLAGLDAGDAMRGDRPAKNSRPSESPDDRDNGLGAEALGFNHELRR